MSGVPEVRERAGYGDVRQRQPVTDQIVTIARDGPLQIIEDRRQLVDLRLSRSLLVARPAQEAGCDDQVEEDLGTARDQDRIREFLEPDGLAAELGIAGISAGSGCLRFQVVDDRA